MGLWCARRALAFHVIPTDYGRSRQVWVHFQPISFILRWPTIELTRQGLHGLEQTPSASAQRPEIRSERQLSAAGGIEFQLINIHSRKEAVLLQQAAQHV